MPTHRLSALLILCALCASAAVPAPAATGRSWQELQGVEPPPELLAEAWRPFTVPEDRVKVILHVDNASPAAADTNPGTVAQPLKTLAKAGELLMASKRAAVGARLVIHPGTYRDSLVLDVPTKAEEQPGCHDNDAPVVIEAATPGTVVLTGADVWNGWQRVPGQNLYTHAWPHKWGFMGNPWQAYDVDYPLMMQRRETVIIGGRPLRAVLAGETLKPGQFAVDETKALITLCPPAGTNMAKTQVEVGTRDAILNVSGLRNVIVRGLTLRYSASLEYQHPFAFYKVRGLIVEDCVSEWHNAFGCVVHMCDDAILRRLTLNHNGQGNSMNFCRNLLVEDVATSYNNWRGAANGWRGWAVSGIKAMYNHGMLFRRHRAVDNQTGGLWLDTDTTTAVFEDCTWNGNTCGIGFENNQGPLAVVNCTMARNMVGINIDKSCNGLLAGCTIADNTCVQVYVGGPPSTEFANWETQQKLGVRCQDWVWEKNLVVSSLDATCVAPTADGNNYILERQARPLVTMPKWDYFLVSLRSAGNIWWHAATEGAFQIGSYGASESLMGMGLPFWQVVTGQDLDSRRVQPRFVDAAKDDLRLTPESAALLMRPQPPLSAEQLAQTRRGLPLGLGKFADALRKLRGAVVALPFERAMRAAPDEFSIVSLAAQANRPLTGPDSWIGLDFWQLASGHQTLLGVPFEAVNQNQNRGLSVIALRSAKVATTAGREVPSRVEVPVGRKASVVYVLHGAGYAPEAVRVGTYSLLYEEGTTSALPVLTYGAEPATTAEKTARAGQATVADWWVTADQFAGDRARCVPILPAGHGPEAKRYLYVVEWANSQPDKVVKAIRFESDPAQAATLMVVAVTLLR